MGEFGPCIGLGSIWHYFCHICNLYIQNIISNYFRGVKALSTANFSRSSVDCNLHGKLIKALTIEEIPYMHFTSENYKNIDHLYHSSSETYDVTNFTSGFLNDFIKIMSFACNFTYEIHVRKDGKQGGVTESNGTLIATGVFDNLINGEGITQKILSNINKIV